MSEKREKKWVTKSSILVAQFVLLHALILYHGLMPSESLADVDQSATIALDEQAAQKPVVTEKKERNEGQHRAAQALLPGALNPSKIFVDGDRMVADLDNGWSADLTVDPYLQKRTKSILTRAKVAFGGVVVLDVKSDNVLVLADHYEEGHPSAPAAPAAGEPAHLTLRPIAPAASVFKVVSSAALLSEGVPLNKEFGFKRAVRRIGSSHIEAPPRGAAKASLGRALATSNNGFFARVTDSKLPRDRLIDTAHAFGFNRVIPFPLLTSASTANIPRNRLERARVAAGFWHTKLTVLHAALIGSAIAGNGDLPSPRLVTRLHSAEGHVVEAPPRQALGQATTPKIAKQLRTAMGDTVKRGTARRSFSSWPKKLKHITVGGKTGSLAKRDPYTSYTWFVGYAPVDDPQIAIAVLVGNGEKWWRRAGDVASDILAAHFSRSGK